MPPRRRSGAYALLIATGILLSRIAGFIRDRVFAHYFGTTDVADAYRAAFRIPNYLQNLFGEGVLSASFIPVYARLLAEGDEKEANRVAGAIFSILSLVMSLLVVLGIWGAPWLVAFIAPGFEGEKRALTVELVRIFFPGAGLLVLSAWCLGILNSHRHFFLSYVAPVIWNLVMIGTMLIFGRFQDPGRLIVTLAWGAVVGSAAQFLMQLPVVLRLARGLRPSLSLAIPGVRTVLRNFVPVVLGRGVIQVSSWVDELIASLLPTGAMSALSYASTLYLLPVSLFGMSVSAAELPVMSSATGTREEIATWLKTRLEPGLRRIAFFIVPSAAAFLFLGDVVAAAVFQTGAFQRDDTLLVWVVLAGATVGLLPSTLSRLYASTFYAMQDTRRPLICAVLRIATGASMAWFASLYLPRWLGVDARFGVGGISAASGLGAWVEFILLRYLLNRRIGRTGLPLGLLARLVAAAALGASAGLGLRLLLPPMHPAILAFFVLGTFGLVYIGAAWTFQVPEVAEITGRLARLRAKVLGGR